MVKNMDCWIIFKSHYLFLNLLFFGLFVVGMSASTNNHVNIYELEQLPIPKVIPKVEKSIINLISAIIAKKQYDPSANISDLECEIYMLLYGLYGLTEEEVEVVEGKDV